LQDAPPFPRRFEVRYSLDEALMARNRKWRRQTLFAGTGSSWPRLISFIFLASGLCFLPLATGSLDKEGLPLVATLLSAAFVSGMYAAWGESRRMLKRTLGPLRAQGKAFGPWDVAVSDTMLEASAGGYCFRMDLAAIREVAMDDRFVVLIIDSSLDFVVPKRCLGGDGPAEALKRFVVDRRADLGAALRS
jgi:hypothetical protein